VQLEPGLRYEFKVSATADSDEVMAAESAVSATFGMPGTLSPLAWSPRHSSVSLSDEESSGDANGKCGVEGAVSHVQSSDHSRGCSKGNFGYPQSGPVADASKRRRLTTNSVKLEHLDGQLDGDISAAQSGVCYAVETQGGNNDFLERYVDVQRATAGLIRDWLGSGSRISDGQRFQLENELGLVERRLVEFSKPGRGALREWR